MNALPGGFLSLHGPVFLPKAGRTWILEGLGEEVAIPLALWWCPWTSALPRDLEDLELTILE